MWWPRSGKSWATTQPIRGTSSTNQELGTDWSPEGRFGARSAQWPLLLCVAPVQQVRRHERNRDQTRGPSQAGSEGIVFRKVDVDGKPADRSEDKDDEKAA